MERKTPFSNGRAKVTVEINVAPTAGYGSDTPITIAQTATCEASEMEVDATISDLTQAARQEASRQTGHLSYPPDPNKAEVEA